ncbi:MAG: alpha/beta fold hydrolase [Acidobacteria bacterium]|nr:alpha/beta fold hydrolase [Acidobacteriota bacterium]
MLTVILTFLLHTLLLAQQGNKTQLPPAAPLLSTALCGKGVFLTSIAGTPVGRETFEIKCVAGGGYAASGQTSAKLPGASIEVETTMELDKAASPTKFTSKGTMMGSPVDQTITFADGKATIRTKEGAQEMLYEKGAAFIMNNVQYPMTFVAAQYDTSRGGVQSIKLFPNLSVNMERTARDAVQPAGAVAAPKPSAFDRYTLQLGQATLILWADAQGRLAAISLPKQKYVAVREEYASFAEPLQAALASTMKELKPDYSAPPDAPFTAEEVKIKVRDYQLAGTLLLPRSGARPFPVVVTSTGSGQQTRDEPVPYPNLREYKIFRQIAEHLAARGIAVLRVDDRGVGDSTGFETLERATTFDFADDVRAQIAYLRTRRELDPKRIAIVGHSEGGIIAPLVAASDPQLAAIALLAGTGKRGDEVLLYQMNRPLELNAALSDEEKAKARAENERIIRTVIEGGDTSRLPSLFHYPWTKAFMTYDPIQTIRKVHQPILIVQGAIDRQVTADQAELLAKAAREAGNADVTLRIFPGLNHLFLPATTGDESEYASLETSRIGDDVIKTIGDWLLFKLQRSEPAKGR